MKKVTITLPDSVSEEAAKRELANALYRSGLVTQGEGAQVAGLDRKGFIDLLSSRS